MWTKWLVRRCLFKKKKWQLSFRDNCHSIDLGLFRSFFLDLFACSLFRLLSVSFAPFVRSFRSL